MPRNGTALAVPEFYYYAAGDRIPLVPMPDVVAVDRAAAGAIAESLGQALPEIGGTLGELTLLAWDKLSAELKASLSCQPVFQALGATLVAMPEVRVEGADPGYRKKLKRWLTDHAELAELANSNKGPATVRPRSGNGLDALKIANLLHEELQIELAQPRFVRIVKRPEPR
jgi:hypothetical protein